MYVHVESNHPPSVIKSIPLGVNKRLCKISSNKDIFDRAAPVYQKALQESGHNHTLKYEEQPTEQQTRKKCRRRNVTWFNIPFHKSIKTPVGRAGKS